ncbi:MAG TPA: SRPBCC family protein [Bacteroidaceae bacterium]|nr:SRPBCC family protein [Bacteroidaceae bacterium]
MNGERIRPNGKEKMTENSVKNIPHPQEMVYRVLSDLNNLEIVVNRFAENEINNLEYTDETVSFSIPGVGVVIFRIVEKEPEREIKFVSDNSFIPLSLAVLIEQVDEFSSTLTLSISADINMIMAGMIRKPLKEGVEKLAQVLAQIPYNTIQ